MIKIKRLRCYLMGEHRTVKIGNAHYCIDCQIQVDEDLDLREQPEEEKEDEKDNQ